MKNWLLALLGSLVRAAPMVPRSNGVGVNSAGRLPYLEPPDAGAGRIAGLGHEARDHAVKLDVVVEAFLGELLHARDMLGREIGPQLDQHAAGLELDDERVLGIGLGCLGLGGSR